MKIENKREPIIRGAKLSAFDSGDSVRMVEASMRTIVVSDNPWIVTRVKNRPAAVRLSDGTLTVEGLFVLEPNAKVVIE